MTHKTDGTNKRPIITHLLDFKEYDWIQKVMNKLTFVKWDRYYWWNSSKPNIIVFGWIRNDEYKDFVVLEFNTKEQAVYFISTSSAEYSEKIAEILGSDHLPCERVETAFNNVRCVYAQQK